MDPLILVFIAICLTILFAPVISKVVSRVISSTAPNQLDYDHRWSDSDYVAMIHKTMALEKENLGEVVTVCECLKHKPKPRPIPPKGPGGGSPIVQRKDHIIADGYRFPWPGTVPEHAHFSIEQVNYPSLGRNGHFKWTNPYTGEQMGCRVIGLPAEPGEMLKVGPFEVEVKKRNDGFVDYDAALSAYENRITSINEARQRIKRPPEFETYKEKR
jgi:hypothetical protein